MLAMPALAVQSQNAIVNIQVNQRILMFRATRPFPRSATNHDNQTDTITIENVMLHIGYTNNTRLQAVLIHQQVGLRTELFKQTATDIACTHHKEIQF